MFVFNELLHILASLLAGFVTWKIFGRKWPAFLAAFCSGFLIDADHLIDYFLVYGFNFNLWSFIRGDQFLASDKLYLLFHGWEYVVLLLIVFLLLKQKTARAVVFALMLSLSFHLTVDSFSNDGMSVKAYSLTYRAKNNFDMERIVTLEHWERHLERKKAR